MFGKKTVILDDYVQNNMNDRVAKESYFDNISIRDICYERNLIDHKMKAEAHTLNLNREMEESSPYHKLNSLEVYNGRRSGIYERNRKNKFDDETFMDILNKNGIKFESKQELTRILAKIRSKYSWSSGFSLQLGSKGRKIMLQLLRLAYRSNKKNKNIFQNKNPPTTISNLPFFKISMLWELANDMGVFEHAILIHELFGSFKKKLITPENTSFYFPDTTTEKYKFKNNIYQRRLSENLELEPKHGELNNPAFCMSQSGDFVKIRDQICQEDSINLLNSIINDVVLSQDHATINPPYTPKAVGLMHQNKHQYSLVSSDEPSNIIKLKGKSSEEINVHVAFEAYNQSVPAANAGISAGQRSFRTNELSSHMNYAPSPQNFIFKENKFRGSPSSVSTCVSSFVDDTMNDHQLLHSASAYDICSPTKGSYSGLSDLNGYMTMDNELTNYDSIFLDSMVANVEQMDSETMESFSSYLNAE
ncbi:hypothetical protein MACJ_000194 [Theileria orientalis]|uniref:Uncharacterized protein n=1 Tax=Theileria orientalis TaxID=68886 RepID=A0A976QR63_THEOR|nr:hypothetical protein MACJ_000194 [Theileria orientalis]